MEPHPYGHSEQTLDVHYGFQSSEKAVVHSKGPCITFDRCSLEVICQVLSPQLMMLLKHPLQGLMPWECALEVILEPQPLPHISWLPYLYHMSCLTVYSSHDGIKANGTGHHELKNANTWVGTKVLSERHMQGVRSLKDTAIPNGSIGSPHLPRIMEHIRCAILSFPVKVSWGMLFLNSKLIGCLWSWI